MERDESGVEEADSGDRKENDLAEGRDDRMEEERVVGEREQRLRRHMTIWVRAEWLGLDERERKGNKVVIKYLEGVCSEISRHTASSNDDVKRIACLVSGRELGKCEVKRGQVGKERGGKKLFEGRRWEVDVAQYNER